VSLSLSSEHTAFLREQARRFRALAAEQGRRLCAQAAECDAEADRQDGLAGDTPDGIFTIGGRDVIRLAGRECQLSKTEAALCRMVWDVDQVEIAGLMNLSNGAIWRKALPEDPTDQRQVKGAIYSAAARLNRKLRDKGLRFELFIRGDFLTRERQPPQRPTDAGSSPYGPLARNAAQP
jgi:hypothetical protein